jgi:hypothetical protein
VMELQRRASARTGRADSARHARLIHDWYWHILSFELSTLNGRDQSEAAIRARRAEDCFWPTPAS